MFHVWTGNAIEQWDAGRYISDRQLSNGLFRGSWGLLTARLLIAENSLYITSMCKQIQHDLSEIYI